ncbi:GntR family transcriptional regulator [Scopulibacillus cellulosilyticus]|uniref:GntR family transcriptional regulator n=1 Tax=Scopulibacillus cellulosilyticus TaxID=2665665 RepID=A0ABW2Q3F4_9BACL
MSRLNVGPAVKKDTIQELTYKQLKKAILTEQLSPDLFYTETDLAEALQISRTPVREAVKELIGAGLLISVPRKGLKIREYTQLEIEQIFLLRKVIEPEILSKLLKTVTAEQIKTLKELVCRQEEAIEKKDELGFIELDQKFHLSLITWTDYNIIEEMIIKLHNITRLIGHKAIRKQKRMEEVIEEHRKIIEALEQKDEAPCKKAMNHHLEKTEQSYRLIDNQ